MRIVAPPARGPAGENGSKWSAEARGTRLGGRGRGKGTGAAHAPDGLVGPALVHEDAADRARARVEVLVRAPRRKVDAPVVQRERDVAGCVREVPAADAALRWRRTARVTSKQLSAAYTLKLRWGKRAPARARHA